MIHRSLAAVAALAATTASAQEVKWDLALFGSPAFRVAGEAFAEKVGELSGGDFVIEAHQGTLSPAREVLDNLSIGAFELGYVVSSYHPGKNPLIAVLDLPFLPIPTMEDRVEVAEALFEHPAVVQEFGRWNTVPVMAVVQPNYEVIGKGEPIESLEDLDGVRMKATSGIGAAFEEFGAATVSMSGAEQYTALQTGVIDAVAATPSAFGGWKLYEVTDWRTEGMEAGTAHVSLVANRDAYMALSDEHRRILEQAADYAYDQTIAAQSEAAETYAPDFEAAGLELVEVPPEMLERLRAEAAQPVWDAYVAELEAKGAPGREILDFTLEQAEAARSGS